MQKQNIPLNEQPQRIAKSEHSLKKNFLIHEIKMTKQKSLLFLLFFLLGGIASLTAYEIRRAMPLQSPLNELAEVLAGITEYDGNALCNPTQASLFTRHDHAMKAAWSDYLAERSLPMQQWAAQEMSARIPAPSVVRYFFSGPDILSLLHFFPESPLYILCAKEPVGKIAPLATLSPEELSISLAAVRENTDTFLKYGYFITKEMKQQLSRGSLQGVFPILLTFLALSNHEILSANPVVLGGSPGLCIRFKSRSSGFEQQLLYVQADLSNDGNTRLWTWLHSFGAGAAYLKAASYLLHEDSFSRARASLLRDSESILQDDSGIPLRFFETSQWTLYFFGDYKGTLSIFKKYRQPDLVNAYATSPLHGPMPFGTGYQLHAGESGGANLLLAVRRRFIPRAKAQYDFPKTTR